VGTLCVGRGNRVPVRCTGMNPPRQFGLLQDRNVDAQQFQGPTGSINVYLPSTQCLADCAPITHPTPPYDIFTCELSDCLKCDDDTSGSMFVELAGMTRRGAGILTSIPRQCSSLAEHEHTCVAAIGV